MNKIQGSPPPQPTKNERQPVDPKLVEAAQGLEAIFTNEMLKAMRNTVEHSEMSLSNSATDIYQGMLDSEYADVAARANALGISQQIIDYWTKGQYSKEREAASAPLGTGGTHASQSKPNRPIESNE